MKIKPEHYDHMKSEIAKVFDRQKHEDHTKFVINEGRSKDVDMRVRWDWSYYANLSPFISKEVYEYANDNHVDTALRRIVSELLTETLR